jgi:hypothetical protein
VLEFTLLFRTGDTRQTVNTRCGGGGGGGARRRRVARGPALASAAAAWPRQRPTGSQAGRPSADDVQQQPAVYLRPVGFR